MACRVDEAELRAGQYDHIGRANAVPRSTDGDPEDDHAPGTS